MVLTFHGHPGYPFHMARDRKANVELMGFLIVVIVLVLAVFWAPLFPASIFGGRMPERTGLFSFRTVSLMCFWETGLVIRGLG